MVGKNIKNLSKKQPGFKPIASQTYVLSTKTLYVPQATQSCRKKTRFGIFFKAYSFNTTNVFALGKSLGLASGPADPHLHCVNHQTPLISFLFPSVYREKYPCAEGRLKGWALSALSASSLSSPLFCSKRGPSRDFSASPKSITCLFKASLWFSLVLDVFHQKQNLADFFLDLIMKFPLRYLILGIVLAMPHLERKKEKHLNHKHPPSSTAKLRRHTGLSPSYRPLLSVAIYAPASHVFHTCLEGILGLREQFLLLFRPWHPLVGSALLSPVACGVNTPSDLVPTSDIELFRKEPVLFPFPTLAQEPPEC